jgi:peptide deformylase
MSILKILTYPDPLLKKKAKKVARVTAEEKKILTDMAETMYLSQGVGLAATQVGIEKQLIVIDIGEGLVKLVNPVIVKKRGRDCMEEGCLSVPGIQVKVRRAEEISVRSLDEEGGLSAFEAGGLFARAIQHEMDHLSGRLIVDFLNPIKRLFVKRKSKKKI